MELKQLLRSWTKDGVPMSQEVKQVYWKELKRIERETRCIDKNGKRCIEDCKQCSHYREGYTLSLDRLMEDGIFLENSSISETNIESLEMLDAFQRMLNTLPEFRRNIIQLHVAGFSEREIGKILNMKQKRVNYWKNKDIAIFKAELESLLSVTL